MKTTKKSVAFEALLNLFRQLCLLATPNMPDNCSRLTRL